ncbi:ROK family protein [Agromyces sp. ISL-38]|uniref:ROK family protein n=1 Tax=Agromyces sp. ISL-38 TaxID=2819107 RepID=UPI001BE70051|nr:ROK family protein [Agromyces sp. ISL-38]MBT2499156.1 ROK family protein [Agromyces sp. ISL-38]MBT2518299.1 ROK family protein [Streptomyces sp. ISL-90]
MRAFDPTAMREANSSLTLRSLYLASGPLTMTELNRTTGLSRRTIELILTDLVTEGWVEPIEPGPATGAGRPPRLYAFRPEHALVGAVQFDTHSTEALVADLSGSVLGRSRRKLTNSTNPDLTLAEARAALLAAVDESGRSLEDFRAVGVAMGGAVDDDGTVVTLVNAPRWAGVRAADALGLPAGVRVITDNDANLAALAEGALGAATDHTSFTWLLAGNRAGSGIIIDGRIHRGFRGAAGEIVEANLLGTRAMEHNPFGLLTSPDPAEREAGEAIVEGVRRGDAEAIAELDAFVAPFAQLLAVFAWTIAPPLIVLGGGLEAGADVLIPSLRSALEAAGAPAMELRASALGREAMLQGALRVAIMSVENELFGSA